jgi:hypothetical protein
MEIQNETDFSRLGNLGKAEIDTRNLDALII